MKKLAFVLGYSGGILALIFSLLMIYLVPINFVAKTVEDIKCEMKNENIVALNEVGIYVADHPDDPITDYSESGLSQYAFRVSRQSGILNDETVYEDTIAFIYKTAFDGIISMALVGISIIFALLAFIGSLAVRKYTTGGAVLMLISSLVLVLSAIYTRTIIPTAIASAVLAAAGIFAFMPFRQVPAQVHARNRQKMQPAAPGQPYPQPPFNPAYASYPQQPLSQPQYVGPAPAGADAPAQAAGAGQAGVPFPEEDEQVFTPPASPDDVK